MPFSSPPLGATCTPLASVRVTSLPVTARVQTAEASGAVMVSPSGICTALSQVPSSTPGA